MLPAEIKVLSLKDIGCFEELPETSDSIEGNSSQKAKYVFSKFGIDTFADDTGLEVESLKNAPGVYSARYAGIPSNSQKNVQKLLKELSNSDKRNAQFRTVITLLRTNEETQFEGIVKGSISLTQKGENGFGYDPVFIADGYNVTFAEMTSNEKNKISHRSIALQKLISHLLKII